MAEIETLYKKVDDKILVEIKLNSVIQMFHSFDPHRFIKKELDAAAEKYIVDIVKAFPKNRLFRIIVHLPEDLVQTERAKIIGKAIHNHFEYLTIVTDRKFREKFRYGRVSLLIGLSFLAVALVARQMVSHFNTIFLAQLFSDAFLIIGWAFLFGVRTSAIVVTGSPVNYYKLVLPHPAFRADPVCRQVLK